MLLAFSPALDLLLYLTSSTLLFLLVSFHLELYHPPPFFFTCNTPLGTASSMLNVLSYSLQFSCGTPRWTLLEIPGAYWIPPPFSFYLSCVLLTILLAGSCPWGDVLCSFGKLDACQGVTVKYISLWLIATGLYVCLIFKYHFCLGLSPFLSRMSMACLRPFWSRLHIS